MKRTVKSCLYTYIVLVFIGSSCKSDQGDAMLDTKPNILWIFLEDTNPLMGCYGEIRIKTPNIDSLAADGMLFQNALMPSPVCSPCRSSIITGIMSTSTGTHNHHSARTEESAIYLPENIQTIPELFKEADYFTFNNGKDDYNFTYDRKDLYDQAYRVHPLYGKSGLSIDLDSLSDKQPFFGQIQLRGGKEIYNGKFKELVKKPVDRSLIKLPPYLPDHPLVVEEYANHLDAIQLTDERVGSILSRLKKNGLLENTIVFFFSDHGMRLTRHKQFLYEGGLRVPLIITDFRKSKAIPESSSYEGLISGIDLGPTALSLAGIEIPHYVEGNDIFSAEGKAREYVVSTRDRCDFTIDRIRSVRTKEYKYIRNFMTDRPATQTTYMDVNQVPYVMAIRQLQEEGRLDSIQSLFFSKRRPEVELYNLADDPHEITNLASDSAYQGILEAHAKILASWISNTDDKGQYPENEENLRLMLGIWGDYVENPEYDILIEKYQGLAGTQFELKNGEWKEFQ